MSNPEKTKLYAGKIELVFDPVKHTYKVRDVIIPSVTQVVGVINKPALMYWAVNQAIGYLQGVWVAGKSYDEVEILNHLEEAKKTNRKTTTDAAIVGTMVHDWISKYIKGHNPLEPVNPAIKAATSAFLQWVSEHKVKFLESEIKIYSKKYAYAGTMDFEAEIDGKLVVGDIKTSSGIYPEARLQVAAYQQARQEETGKTYDHRVIIRVGKVLIEDKPDFEIAEFNDFKLDIKAFLGALLLTNRLNNFKKEAKNGTGN